jgi:hypothetical protein
VAVVLAWADLEVVVDRSFAPAVCVMVAAEVTMVFGCRLV